jgi:hypothetical protein
MHDPRLRIGMKLDTVCLRSLAQIKEDLAIRSALARDQRESPDRAACK